MSVILFCVLLQLGLLVIVVLSRKPHYAPGVYYATRFVVGLSFHELQVRYQIMIQLGAILLCLCAIALSDYRDLHRLSGPLRAPRASLQLLQRHSVLLLLLLLWGTGWGLVNRYAFFSLLIDLYKYLEIFLFAFFLSYALRSLDDAEECLRLLILEMCLFGLVEIFTARRGGVGVNIAISWTPIWICSGRGRSRYAFWGPVMWATILVFWSQTRTYMLGFALGLILCLLLSPSGRRKEALGHLVLASSVAVFVVTTVLDFFPKSRIAHIIMRIELLSEGFDTAGGYRINELALALQKSLESPVTGKGFGYQEMVFIEKQGTFLWGNFMHNSYAEILLKTGIIGVTLALLCLLFYWRLCFRLLRKNSSSQAWGYLLGGMIATFSWMVIYLAAPLSSYGHVFLPSLFGILCCQLADSDARRLSP